MTSTMQAILLSDIAKLELKEFPIPKVNAHNVLVKVKAVGLCGSDFHIFSGEANYNTDKRGKPIPLLEQPQILGHEIVGEVAEVGKEVEDLQVGDHVVIDQGLNCVSNRKKQLCEYCITGDSHQCEFYGEHGITGLPGGLAEYIALPAVNLIRINSDLDRVEAALTESLSCIIHAWDRLVRCRSRYVVGAEEIERRVKSILIFGGGPAGFMFIQYLRNVLKYDGLVLVSEPNAQRRDLATRFGAVTVDPFAEDLAEVIEEKTNGRRVECIIDASGAGSVFKSIPGLIRKQGTILLYGYGHLGTDLSVLNNLQFMEPTLVTATGGSGGFDSKGRPLTYQKALELLETKQINVASWITHRYQSLADVPQAFISDHHDPNYIKGVAVL